MKHLLQTAALAALLVSAIPAAASQAPPLPSVPQAPREPAVAPPPSPQMISDDDAEKTRERLRTILRQYPPSLADVLRLDPTLLSNDAYLAPYPELSAFLKQHPNIVHNPAFFVGASRSEWTSQPQSTGRDAVRMMEDVLAGAFVLIGVVCFMTLVGWSIRKLVDHRRWLRMSKLQADAHAKVFDRLSSNEDLLAYIQSPAGQKFLESAPIVTEGARSLDAPVGRILFTSQIGTVVTFVGFAMAYVTSHLANNSNPEVYQVAPFLFTASALAIAVGIGFLASSGVAYALSRKLGLLEETKSSHA